MNSRVVFRAGAAALGLAALIGCGSGGTAANNGATAAQATPTRPVQAALAEFDQVCGRVADRDGYVAAAPAAGWTAFEPAADSPVGRLIAMGQTAGREAAAEIGEGEMRHENAAFRKTVGGRELILLVSLIELPRMQASTECRVYDTTAAAPTEAEISAWTRTPPTSRAREQGLTAFEWQPGFRPGFRNISVVHLDPASPLRSRIPVVGLGITSIQGPPSA